MIFSVFLILPISYNIKLLLALLPISATHVGTPFVAAAVRNGMM